MSKELDNAKAAFDADLANPNKAMTSEEISAVLKAVTDPDEQREFVLYMVARSATVSTVDDGVDLDKVTEFFESLANEPNGAVNITRERFDELSSPLTRDEKLYCAKLLIKEQARRGDSNTPIRKDVLARPGVRYEAIAEYRDKLTKVISKYGSPTREQYADITSHMNDAEREVITELQMQLSGGHPLPFRNDRLH